MTIYQLSDKHLENPQDEAAASGLASALTQLYTAASPGPRLRAEQVWHTNELYREGYHSMCQQGEFPTRQLPNTKKDDRPCIKPDELGSACCRKPALSLISHQSPVGID